MRFIHQKQIVPLISLRKIAFQSGIRIKYIVIITDNAVCPAADVQTEFKGADLIPVRILKKNLPGNALLFMDDIKHGIIHPVKMPLCAGTGIRVAFGLFHGAEFFFRCDSHGGKQHALPAKQRKAVFCHASGNGLRRQVKQLLSGPIAHGF